VSRVGTRRSVSGPSLTVGVLIERVEDGYMVVNQDANWNVVSATDLAGRVLERTFYTAYGLPTFNSETYFGDYDGDGDVGSTDDGHLGSGQTCWGASPSGACRVFDFDQDGDLDNDDQTIMTSLVGLASTNHVRLARTSGTVGGLLAHQGLFLDAEVGQYQNRARAYIPLLMRFPQLDPSGYIDGMGRYSYTGANPNSKFDSSGKATFVAVASALLGDPVEPDWYPPMEIPVPDPWAPQPPEGPPAPGDPNWGPNGEYIPPGPYPPDPMFPGVIWPNRPTPCQWYTIQGQRRCFGTCTEGPCHKYYRYECKKGGWCGVGTGCGCLDFF